MAAFMVDMTPKGTMVSSRKQAKEKEEASSERRLEEDMTAWGGGRPSNELIPLSQQYPDRESQRRIINE